jgi:hypothetical protein
MPKFQIFYTVTTSGSNEVEAETLEDAIEKWDNDPMKGNGESGVIEYDGYTGEFFSWNEKEKNNG